MNRSGYLGIRGGNRSGHLGMQGAPPPNFLHIPLKVWKFPLFFGHTFQLCIWLTFYTNNLPITHILLTIWFKNISNISVFTPSSVHPCSFHLKDIKDKHVSQFVQTIIKKNIINKYGNFHYSPFSLRWRAQFWKRTLLFPKIDFLSLKKWKFRKNSK